MIVSNDVQTAYDGQALMHESCGQAVFCHSVEANNMPANRFGVPHGLDFDLRPWDGTDEGMIALLRGQLSTRNWRHDIWGEVKRGTMPPDRVGADVQGSVGAWKVVAAGGAGDAGAAEPPLQVGESLPPLSTEQGQAILRNWLACNAPVATDPPDRTPIQANWDSIYINAIRGNCVSCHSDTAAASLGGGFSFGDDPHGEGAACAAWQAIYERPANSPDCAGSTLIQPENPDGSLLLQKLAATTAAEVCGPSVMPPTRTTVDTHVVNAIEAWIRAGASGPEGCTSP